LDNTELIKCILTCSCNQPNTIKQSSKLL